MKNARPHHTAETSAPNKRDSTQQKKFLGTANPRHIRAIFALMNRPLPREALDSIAGCANGPDLIFQLRDQGLEIPCYRIEIEDRDGNVCRPGIYDLSGRDRTQINGWLSRMQKRTDGRAFRQRQMRIGEDA